jgi:hypothetical protein
VVAEVADVRLRHADLLYNADMGRRPDREAPRTVAHERECCVCSNRTQTWTLCMPRFGRVF